MGLMQHPSRYCGCLHLINDFGVGQSTVNVSMFIHYLCKLLFLLLNGNLLIFEQFADLLF